MCQAILFLLAHQDDELGVFFEIEKSAAEGRRVVCFYLTDGGARHPSWQRNEETLGVLRKLGVESGNVHFLGEALGVRDGHLVEHLERVYENLEAYLARLDPIDRLIVHAWEGGHPDHDAAHVIGVSLAQSLGCLATSRQFPIYRAAVGLSPFFVIFSPLPDNGIAEMQPIRIASRLKYLRYCFHYKTQRATILLLLPFMILDYMFSGVQKLQALNPSRVAERPHVGRLLYEAHSRFTFEAFRRAAMEFISVCSRR